MHRLRYIVKSFVLDKIKDFLDKIIFIVDKIKLNIFNLYMKHYMITNIIYISITTKYRYFNKI